MTANEFIHDLKKELETIAKNETENANNVTRDTGLRLQGRADLAFELIIKIDIWQTEALLND